MKLTPVDGSSGATRRKAYHSARQTSVLAGISGWHYGEDDP